MDLRNRLYDKAFQTRLELIANDSVVARRLLEAANQTLDSNFTRNVSYTGDGLITALPVGKESILNAEGTEWATKNRIAMKPGKFVNTWAAEFALSFFDTDIEKFVNLLSGVSKPVNELGFKSVNGADIIKFYHQNSYSRHENTGTLAKSCMRETAQTPLVKFYAANNHRISLLVRFDGGGQNIVGRALVWKTAKGITFMDRIYADDKNTEIFKRFAREHGWYHKKNQNYSVGQMVSPSGTDHDMGDVYVTDLVIQDEKMPYLDTFTCAYPNLGIMATNEGLFGGMDFHGRYQATSGNSTGKNGRIIPNRGIVLSNAVEGYMTYADLERRTGSFFIRDEVFIDFHLKQNFHLSNVVFGITGKKYVKDNPHICIADGEKFNGYVLKNDCARCFYTGKTYLRKLHMFKTFTILDSVNAVRTLEVLDQNVEPFVRDYLLLEKDGKVTLPRTFAQTFGDGAIARLTPIAQTSIEFPSIELKKKPSKANAGGNLRAAERETNDGSYLAW